eukprot:UC4_evm1s1461
MDPQLREFLEGSHDDRESGDGDNAYAYSSDAISSLSISLESDLQSTTDDGNEELSSSISGLPMSLSPCTAPDKKGKINARSRPADVTSSAEIHGDPLNATALDISVSTLGGTSTSAITRGSTSISSPGRSWIKKKDQKRFPPHEIDSDTTSDPPAEKVTQPLNVPSWLESDELMPDQSLKGAASTRQKTVNTRKWSDKDPWSDEEQVGNGKNVFLTSREEDSPESKSALAAAISPLASTKDSFLADSLEIENSSSVPPRLTSVSTDVPSTLSPGKSGSRDGFPVPVLDYTAQAAKAASTGLALDATNATLDLPTIRFDNTASGSDLNSEQGDESEAEREEKARFFQNKNKLK